ncbi:MAG: hypothetical protein WCK11_00735 [Candidatus Falkowbacteria bacterium]
MKTPVIIAVVCVVAIAAFFGGMTYGKSTVSKGTQVGVQNGQAGFGSGQAGRGAMGQGFRGPNGQGRANGGFINGEVLKKDAQSVTVKLPDGGSKIAFISGNTAILKTATGSLTDVIIGENVSINGNPNTDGSVTAQTISIRPPRPSNGMASGTPINNDALPIK